MATENKQTWGARSKKTSVIALGLVAILAGVAVAYFLTSQKFGNNRALGGTLSVDATLPMDLSEDPLYPVNGTTTSDQHAEDEFTITNNNSVDVTYLLFATCEECIPDPADTEAAATARANKADQFNNLFIRIYKPSETCLGNLPVDELCNPSEQEVHQGKLADLTPTNPANLGEIGDGDDVTYTVRLWLQNDDTRAQPQGVENIWEFFVNAKTPA